MVTLIEVVLVEVRERHPPNIATLVIADWLCALWREHNEPHVVVQVRLHIWRRDFMDVEVNCRIYDFEPLDAALFGRFFQGDPGQIGLAVGVPARLEPTLEFGVKQQKRCLLYTSPSPRDRG